MQINGHNAHARAALEADALLKNFAAIDGPIRTGSRGTGINYAGSSSVRRSGCGHAHRNLRSCGVLFSMRDRPAFLSLLGIRTSIYETGIQIQ